MKAMFLGDRFWQKFINIPARSLYPESVYLSVHLSICYALWF